MMKISKELLSAVLGDDMYPKEIENNLLLFKQVADAPWSAMRSINIYELMHLMKEWAYKYGHEMVSYHIQDSNEWRCLYAHISIDLNIDKRVGFYAETEFEAVTKACEYILEQLKDK